MAEDDIDGFQMVDNESSCANPSVVLSQPGRDAPLQMSTGAEVGHSETDFVEDTKEATDGESGAEGASSSLEEASDGDEAEDDHSKSAEDTGEEEEVKAEDTGKKENQGGVDCSAAEGTEEKSGADGASSFSMAASDGDKAKDKDDEEFQMVNPHEPGGKSRIADKDAETAEVSKAEKDGFPNTEKFLEKCKMEHEQKKKLAALQGDVEYLPAEETEGKNGSEGALSSPEKTRGCDSAMNEDAASRETTPKKMQDASNSAKDCEAEAQPPAEEGVPARDSARGHTPDPEEEHQEALSPLAWMSARAPPTATLAKAVLWALLFIVGAYVLLIQHHVVIVGSRRDDFESLSAEIRNHADVNVWLWSLWAPEDPRGMEPTHFWHSAALLLATIPRRSNIVIAERLSVDNFQRDPMGKYRLYVGNLLPWWQWLRSRPFAVALLHGECPGMVELLTSNSPESSFQSPQVLTVECQQTRHFVFDKFVAVKGMPTLGARAERRLFHDVTAKSAKGFVTSLLHGGQLERWRGESEPCPADDKARLLLSLRHAPCDPFPAGEQRSRMKQAFPDYHFVVVGRAGVGKSTFLHWLAVHGMLEDEVVTKFGTNTGGSSHTLTLTRARFGPHVLLFDTKGLPSWDLSHIAQLESLVGGQVSEGPMHWRKPNVFSDPVLVTAVIGLLTACVLATNKLEERPRVLAEWLLISLIAVLFLLVVHGAPMMGGAPVKNPATTPHAMLFIASFPSEARTPDGDLVPLQSAEGIREARAFVEEMREKMPTLPIVVAVTHLHRCTKGRPDTAQECSEMLANAIGLMEAGNVFALAADGESKRKAGEVKVKLSPATLAPIVERLKLKANAYYERELKLSV